MKFINAIICDDVRKEENGKHMIIGVYLNDIIVTEFPAKSQICTWFQFFADRNGDVELEFQYSLGQKRAASGVGLVKVNDCTKKMTLVLPPMLISLDREQELNLKLREKGARWTTVCRLEVKMAI